MPSTNLSAREQLDAILFARGDQVLKLLPNMKVSRIAGDSLEAVVRKKPELLIPHLTNGETIETAREAVTNQRKTLVPMVKNLKKSRRTLGKLGKVQAMIDRLKNLSDESSLIKFAYPPTGLKDVLAHLTKIRGFNYAKREALLARKLKPAKLPPMPGAPKFSARDEFNSIIELADARPRNDQGMFTGAEEGPNQNAMAITYQQSKSIGQNLAGGAVAGIGGVASGSALKALIGKIRKAKV